MKHKATAYRGYFLLTFVLIVTALGIAKCVNPDLTLHRIIETTKVQPEAAATPHEPDSIELQARLVDSLLLRPRAKLTLLKPDGKPVKNRVTSVRRFEESFPDLNDVQLATAQRLGVESCADREEASQRRTEFVYIGASPFYDIEHLSHSIPYLVPRAARLLDEIGRAFLDSLASKGIPFHKMVATSVLRTEEDVKRLRRHNGNASEQSCHRYATTFDISYNVFHRVQDPDLPPQPETWAVTLKSVLAEVLADQRRLGTCWVKYEYRQSCFHITCR